ncbi:MAG: Hsp20 family protein [Rhodospirillales bacterium]
MSRIAVFNSPLLLGFDRLERIIDQVAKSSDGYPPYNIEQTNEQTLRITLAVAGFRLEDLKVSLEGNQLVVRGRRPEEDRERVFLHRGLAFRQFQRSFVLADGIEVAGATLDHGLLEIELRRTEPEPQVRTIAISKGVKSAGASAIPSAKAVRVTAES